MRPSQTPTWLGLQVSAADLAKIVEKCVASDDDDAEFRAARTDLAKQIKRCADLEARRVRKAAESAEPEKAEEKPAAAEAGAETPMDVDSLIDELPEEDLDKVLQGDTTADKRKILQQALKEVKRRKQG